MPIPDYRPVRVDKAQNYVVCIMARRVSKQSVAAAYLVPVSASIPCIQPLPVLLMSPLPPDIIPSCHWCRHPGQFECCANGIQITQIQPPLKQGVEAANNILHTASKHHSISSQQIHITAGQLSQADRDLPLSSEYEWSTSTWSGVPLRHCTNSSPS
jgi:hypothetical protein